METVWGYARLKITSFPILKSHAMLYYCQSYTINCLLAKKNIVNKDLVQ